MDSHALRSFRSHMLQRLHHASCHSNMPAGGPGSAWLGRSLLSLNRALTSSKLSSSAHGTGVLCVNLVVTGMQIYTQD